MFLAVREHEAPDTLVVPYIRELSQTEADLYRESIKVFGGFSEYEFALEYVLENESEFFTSMQDCVHQAMGLTSLEPVIEGYVSLANRKLLNYFSSVRFFADFVLKKLSRLFGKESAEVVRFKAELSRVYDSSFAYRFSSKFRNYVQHCGHAVGQLEIRAPTGEDAYHLTLTCKTNDLINDYDSWGKLKIELQNRTLIDVIAIVRAVTADVRGLDAFVREMLLESISKAGSDIKEIVKAALERKGEPVVVDADISKGLDNLKQIPMSIVPLTQMKKLGIL